MTQDQAGRFFSMHNPPDNSRSVPQSRRNLPSEPPVQPVTPGEMKPALPKGCFPGRGAREDFAVGGGEEPEAPCRPPLRGEPAALRAALSNKIALCCALH